MSLLRQVQRHAEDKVARVDQPMLSIRPTRAAIAAVNSPASTGASPHEPDNLQGERGDGPVDWLAQLELSRGGSDR